jgi:hypothetical protein
MVATRNEESAACGCAFFYYLIQFNGSNNSTALGSRVDLDFLMEVPRRESFAHLNPEALVGAQVNAEIAKAPLISSRAGEIESPLRTL